jgi:hypothetical protein
MNGFSEGFWGPIRREGFFLEYGRNRPYPIGGTHSMDHI